MSNETETFAVAEGITSLDGKPVKNRRVSMTLSQALYHLSLGRIQRANTVKKTAAVGKSTDPRRQDDDQPENEAAN